MTLNNNFWDILERPLDSSKVVIDRPKGSVHPRYEGLVYKLDHGYLDGRKSSDHGGIDVWIGSEPGKQLNAVMCTVDIVKNNAELKLLIGCTQKEKAYINSFYNDWPQIGGILIERDDSKIV